MIRRRVVVHGTVQGVGFRYACRREAAQRHVDGWVTNRSDGAVEAVFEGGSADVEALVKWARSGPPAARVTEVDVSEEPPEGEPGFQVR